jgi:sulfonate transport system ATP-binding protein
VLLLDAGRIAVDQSIDLPSPRSYRQPRFLAYRESLLEALGVNGTET